MSIQVREACASDAVAWDDYVLQHGDGTFCHRFGWKTVIETGAGQTCPFLLAEENGIIVGVLPLSLRNSLLFGKACISTMFAVYGGPLANCNAVLKLLNERAWKITQANNIASLEYKTIKRTSLDNDAWHVAENEAATFYKVLKETPEDILLDIPRKQRAVVRKTLKNNITCSWERDLDTFYKLYAMSVRNLGTPVFPKKLFKAFLEVFSDDVTIQIIKSPDGEAIASLMSFYHKDHVLPYYAGGNNKARTYGAHDFMYYELMLHAFKRGCRVFDFGRSKVGTGPYKFKKNWGFEPTPLEYQYKVAEGMEKVNLNPQNKKFEMLVKIWKKLPLPIANVIGPVLSRHLG